MKKIVIFDLDSTLIGKSYELTLPHDVVQEKFRLFQEQGNIVGLCSDSPMPTMKRWAEKCNIKGSRNSIKRNPIFFWKK